LHDVIAHSVSVMVVQAGAASEVIDRDPSRAAQALERIQQAGRDALTEMGVLVGLLREQDQDADRMPYPGLDQLGELVDQASAAGVPVDLQITGPPRPVPPGLQLSIYRVVQEALTNARKHSRATGARVSIDFCTDDVVLEVANDGPPNPGGTGSNRGILGMRERIAAYGGTVDAGPGPEDGFVVRARIPLGAT
jgi:signal transduction histidine kinase